MKNTAVLCVYMSLSLAQVDTVWTARFNGADGYNDAPCDITSDAVGNIYVTGFVSVGGPVVFTKDYATIKYNSAGDSVWLNTYNGPWSDDDYPVGIELEGSDYIYVCGASVGMDATFDYTLVKYDVNGVTQWVRNTNGPWGDHDYPADFIVDDSGNVFVTGYTNGAWTYRDIMTVKYNSSGDTAWIRTYNHIADKNDVAADIAVDVTGNTYVTGRSWDYVTKDDYVTIKYDPDGNEEWVVRYNGTADSSDGAAAIAVDANSIYVTGSSWFPGSSKDIVTVKYDSNGDTVWARRHSGSGNGDDIPNEILIDSSGSVYVAGYSNEATVDYCIFKYDSSGNELWVNNYNGPGNSVDRAHTMVIDDSGNVFVTGESYGSGSNDDYATVKYDENGGEVWAMRYNGAANGHDKAYALALDDNGYVYVTGESFGGPGAYMDYLTIKYTQETGIEERIVKKYLPTMTVRNSIFLHESEVAITLSKPDYIELRIFDIQGRLIKTLVNTHLKEGEYILRWMGRDTQEREVPGGVYLVQLMTSSDVLTQKIIKLQ